MRPDNDTTSDRAGSGRGLILVGAVSVALISTAAAYVAMVGFGRDVLAMGAINAYAFAGVFELSLVTVALMAREAAQQDRPAQTLLSLTWLLSAASGFFAGWHEIHLDHAVTAAAFRFIVPLLAALMWHLALVGDRHLAMERSWSDLRMGARMHALLATRVEWRRARDTALRKPTARSRRKLERAQKRYWRAEAVALRTVAPGAMRDQITQWVDAFSAVAEGTRQADRLPITLPAAQLVELVGPREQVSATQVPNDLSDLPRDTSAALATADPRRRVSSRVTEAVRTAADAAPGAGVTPTFSSARTAAQPTEPVEDLLDRIPFPENIPDPDPAMDYPDSHPDEEDLLSNLPADPREAARILVRAGAPVSKVADKLEVSPSTIRRWTKDRV